jgi:outer membrane protein TolC
MSWDAVARLGVRIVLVATFCVVSVAACAAEDRPRLTLAGAVREALQRNERLVDQRDTTEQAVLGLRLARNEFKPKIVPNVLGSFGQTDINSQTYRIDVSQRFTTGSEFRIGVGTATAQIPTVGDDIHFYNADTTVTFTQPLLRGFGPAVARRPLAAAELRRSDADRQQLAAEQQVALDVASAYYRVVAQQSLIDVAQKSLERSRTLRDASEAKLGAGLVSQLDVLRAQQLVAQAEIQLFDAQTATDDARDHLLILIGRDAGAQIEVEAMMPAAPTEHISSEDAVTAALAHRLDLRSASALAADADRQIAFARNQLLPQVDVNFAYTRRETADTFARSFGLDRFRFATFFTITSPIDRTAQIVDYQNAVIDRDRRRRGVDTMRRRIVEDVQRGLRSRDRLRRLVAAAETAALLSRREVEVAQLRYERGLSNNLDVVSAESNLLTTESRLSGALADSALAELMLRVIVGTLDPRADFSRPAAPDSSLTPPQ